MVAAYEGLDAVGMPMRRDYPVLRLNRCHDGQTDPSANERCIPRRQHDQPLEGKRMTNQVIQDAAASKFADWERCAERHGSQAAHLLDCDDTAVLRDRWPSRGGYIPGQGAPVPMWTSGNLVSFTGPNGPWQSVIFK